MGLIKTGVGFAGAIGLIQAVSKAVEKHNSNKSPKQAQQATRDGPQYPTDAFVSPREDQWAHVPQDYRPQGYLSQGYQHEDYQRGLDSPQQYSEPPPAFSAQDVKKS